MNQETKPFVRSEGAGPTVICLHASAGSSRQWQPLIKRLRNRYRVMAVDLYGHGLTPDWKCERSLSVDDEAALIEPLVEGVPEGVYLVGQGYGAVVALKLALAQRNRIRGLVLYEPTPFALLSADKSSQPAALETGMLRLSTRGHLRARDRLTAAQRFVNYCSGDGSWRSLHFWQQQAMAQSMPAVQAYTSPSGELRRHYGRDQECNGNGFYRSRVASRRERGTGSAVLRLDRRDFSQ